MFLVKLSPGKSKKEKICLVKSEEALHKLLAKEWRMYRRVRIHELGPEVFTGRAIAVAGEWRLNKTATAHGAAFLD